MALWNALLSFVRFVLDATCHNAVMAKKKRAPTQAEALGIVIDHAEAPGAQQRLARAYDLVLRAAARAEAVKEASKGVARQDTEGECTGSEEDDT